MMRHILGAITMQAAADQSQSCQPPAVAPAAVPGVMVGDVLGLDTALCKG
jgi:hypothetical protein